MSRLRTFFTFCVAALCSTGIAMAETVASGTLETGLSWTLDDEGTLTITGEGAMTQWGAFTSSGSNLAYTSSIKNVVIGAGVTSIGEYAFAFCTNLESVTFEEDCVVTTISQYAFYGCTALKSITIPASVTTIGASAFYQCYALATVTFEEGSALTSIGSHAFYACTSLTSISIPEGVTTIASYTFFGCSSLTSITIPDTVTTIESWAFGDCYNVETLVIGSGVTSIGDYAFYNMHKLTSITSLNTTVPTITATTFNSQSAATLTVYASAYDDYAADQYWGQFLSTSTIKDAVEITTTVESVTITYGDPEVDVDALVETDAEYTVTYAQVDEEGNIIEGTETTEQPTEAGDYVIIYTIEETDTTAETVVEIPLTIEKKDTDALSDIDPDGYTTESGTVIDFEELVTPEDPDAEVTVTYTDADGNVYDEQPTEPGEYTVTITIGDTDNINGDEIETTLTVTAGGNEGGSTAIEDVEATTSVNVVAGDIVIETAEALQVRIYSISGALAADTVVNGVAKFSVAKGTYIVVLSNGLATKVLVK